MKNTFIKTLLFLSVLLCLFVLLHKKAQQKFIWKPTGMTHQYSDPSFHESPHASQLYISVDIRSHSMHSAQDVLWKCHKKEKPSYTHTLKLVIQLLTFRYHCLVIMFYTLSLKM